MRTILTDYLPDGFNGRKHNHNGQYYESLGYQKAKKASGHTSALKDNLSTIYEEHRVDIANDLEQQNKIKQDKKRKMDRLMSENEEWENIIKKEKSEHIEYHQNQINQLRDEIAEIKKDPPTPDNGVKVEKTGFYVGLGILVFMTLYLFIFYSSASYSGFFRVFQPGINVREAMLDPNTFAKALNDGAGELLFVLLMPFVFLALGYLIHKFIQKKSLANYLKVLLLLMVTFMFDGFLAYKISEGIYSVSGTLFTEEYTVAKALREVDFWVVIFAGFVAYIVWGLVFDFVMQAHQKLNQIWSMIRYRKDKIKEKEDAIAKSQKRINKYNKKIERNKIAYVENEKVVQGNILNLEGINLIHSQFMTGWKTQLIDLGKSTELIEKTDEIANYCLATFKYNLRNT